MLKLSNLELEKRLSYIPSYFLRGNMNNFELVIFDLDGTLLDTAPDVHDCLIKTLEILNLPPITIEQTKMAIGPNHETFAKIAMGGATKQKVLEFFQIFGPMYSENCAVKTRPFSGITNVLDKLENVKLAVASNKRLEITKSTLEQLKLKNRFELIVGPETVEKPKPAPDMILYCAEQVEIPIEKTILIGDTDNDILAANAAGAKSCLAGWGYSKEQEKLAKMSDYYIQSPDELTNIILN